MSFTVSHRPSLPGGAARHKDPRGNNVRGWMGLVGPGWVVLSEAGLAAVFAGLGPLLDERQRRALVGVTARALGRGGRRA